MIDKLIEKIKKIEDEDRVNEFIIFTSVDTWGEQAEYIRNGLEFNRIWDNMNKILEKCPRVNLTIMSTYNALSVPNYHKLIEGVYDLKEKYGSSDRYWISSIFRLKLFKISTTSNYTSFTRCLDKKYFEHNLLIYLFSILNTNILDIQILKYKK